MDTNKEGVTFTVLYKSVLSVYTDSYSFGKTMQNPIHA